MTPQLMLNERILFRTRLHWAAFLPAALALVLAAPALLLPTVTLDLSLAGMAPRLGSVVVPVGLWAALGCLALSGEAGLRAWALYRASEFVLTDRRVLAVRGVVRRESVAFVLSKVEAVRVSVSGLGRVLGFGTVEVRGTGGTRELFLGLAEPAEFARRVMEQVHAAAGRPAGHVRPPDQSKS